MFKNSRILIVDDDSAIRDVLKIQLKNQGYNVLEAACGEQAIKSIKDDSSIDLIILDIMMPGMDGVETCRKIRELSDVPILFLTAKSSISDKSLAYGSGGDDYLVKPFSRNEMLLKVQSLLRRYIEYKNKPEKISTQIIVLGSISVDLSIRTVFKDGEIVLLTDTEYGILTYLLQYRGKTIGAKELYENVWKDNFLTSSANTVMVHILNLRKKLGDAENPSTLIRTVWGRGYTIDEE